MTRFQATRPSLPTNLHAWRPPWNSANIRHYGRLNLCGPPADVWRYERVGRLNRYDEGRRSRRTHVT